MSKSPLETHAHTPQLSKRTPLLCWAAKNSHFLKVRVFALRTHKAPLLAFTCGIYNRGRRARERPGAQRARPLWGHEPPSCAYNVFTGSESSAPWRPLSYTRTHARLYFFPMLASERIYILPFPFYPRRSCAPPQLSLVRAKGEV